MEKQMCARCGKECEVLVPSQDGDTGYCESCADVLEARAELERDEVDPSDLVHELMENNF